MGVRSRSLLMFFVLGPLTMFRSAPLNALTVEKGNFFGELSGFAEVSATVPLVSDTPDEDPSGVLSLEMKGDITPWLRAYFAPRFSYEGTVAEPIDDNPFQEFDEVYQGKAPILELDAAYVEISRERWDLRLGVQKIQWGVLDDLNPTNNINPQDFGRFFLEQQVDRQVGVPLVRLSTYPRMDLTVEAVWVPFFVPYRMARLGERWFPSILLPPPFVDTGLPGIPPVRVDYRLVEADLPPHKLENSEVAFRVSGTFRGVDLAASYFYGYDTNMPVYRGEGWIEASIAPPFRPQVSYTIDAYPQLNKIHVLGIEATRVFGSVTLRTEWAYFRGSYHTIDYMDFDIDTYLEGMTVSDLYRQGLEYMLRTGEPRAIVPLSPRLSLKSDAIHGGVGGDYMFQGDNTLVFQVMVDHILDYDDRMLNEELEVMGIVVLRLSLFGDWPNELLHVDVPVMYDLTNNAVLLRPEVAWKARESLWLTTRLIWVEGSTDSLVGAFRDNDQVQFFLRYTF